MLRHIVKTAIRGLARQKLFTTINVVGLAIGLSGCLLIFGFVQTYSPRATPLFFLLAIVMILYIPVGKIRHCFFFFYTRILFGLFYGRRDVLPPKTHGI